MTANEIKQIFARYGELKAECQRLRDHIDEKRETLDYLQSIPRANARQYAEDAAVQIENTVRIYLDHLARMEKAEQQIQQMIGCVDEPLGRSILFLRCIKGNRFTDIADETGISLRGIYYKYEAAVRQIEAATEQQETPKE